MSQRTLKYTLCGGDHSIFHCENRCGVCHGDSRQCSCNERPPQKRKKTSKSTASSQQPADTSHDDLKKKYESLQKDYKRVGQAFQNLKEQNQELTALLEECEKEAEELANLARNKDEVVKNLKRRPLNAKKVIAELRAEVRRSDQPAPQEDPPASQQQHQQTADIRVSTHSLANIHERYDQVLQTMKENRCSMACAFHLAGCPRSTLRGNSRIEKGRPEGTGARLPRPRSDISARSGGCVSQKTSALHPGHEQHEERGAAVANEVRGMIRRVKYLIYFTTHKTAPLGATKSMKVNDQQ